jgi:hypothetical protein
VELTMTSNDPITAALHQLAGHHDQITGLDTREAEHFTIITARLAELTDLITSIGRTLDDDTAALARLQALDQQVADLAAQLTADGADPGHYHPDPAPPWWKLAAADRAEPLTRLRAWVEQVYRPGYGHLAATLGSCWPSHDLCLYGLDIMSGLWSVLYLQPRTTRLLSGQAEYQARILPALAAQLMTETSGCAHTRHRFPGPGQSRSA